MSLYTDEEPCPCDMCDDFTLMEGEYCTKCMHHGCGYGKCRCPRAKQSRSYCDFCHTSDVETVSARPNSDGNRICGDCHPSGSLPERERWWEPISCQRCDTENPYSESASCSNCGFVPPENRL